MESVSFCNWPLNVRDKRRHFFDVVIATIAVLMLAGAVDAFSGETPRRGGVLTFTVSAEPPSFDGHQEITFALIHPIAPFYSTLIRVNPDNPASPDDFVCDLCTRIPKPAEGGNKFTFLIRKDVKFHDNTPLTAHDIVATYEKIISPPPGVRSPRKAFYDMVKKIYATDDHTVVFELKYPSGAFIPALANPFNFIYPKRILEKDTHWFEKNVLGSGPFIFVRHKTGALIEGRRNPNYHHEGKPYLEGFRAMFVKHQSARVQAIKEGRASIEFRGFPPRIRNRLLRSLKHLVKVQESDWNCGLLIVPNHKIKPFDDPRVRRALTLAIDRWGAPGYLSRIAIVRTVGGIVFPGHPLAATKKELEKIAGYWPDLKNSRIEARRLLREAGVPIGFTFKFLNRGVDQPYRVIGAWVANQWKEIGLNAEQWVLPTDAWLRTLQGKGERFDVGIDSFCNSVPNPLLEVAKFISDDRSGDNHGRYKDRILDELFDKMNRSSNTAQQRRLMRKFERRLLDEQAHMFTTLWWYRIVPYRSDLRGWRISSSHYLNQDLSNIWLKRKQK